MEPVEEGPALAVPGVFARLVLGREDFIASHPATRNMSHIVGTRMKLTSSCTTLAAQLLCGSRCVLPCMARMMLQ